MHDSHKLRPKNLHVSNNIHYFTAWLHVALMYVFTVISLSMVPIFEGPYFDFGAPVNVMGLVINDNYTIVGVIVFFLFDSMVGAIFDEVVLLTSEYTKGNLKLLVKCIGVIAWYMRYAIRVVFMRVQISFTLAIVLSHLVWYALGKTVAIRHRYEGCRKSPFMRQALLIVCLFQVLEFPMYLAVYMFTGIFDQTTYFGIGVPLSVFDSQIASIAVFIVIILLSFGDCFLTSVVRNELEPWQNECLLNSNADEDALCMHTMEARLVAVTRRVIYYFRIIFVLTFITTQYFFVFVYIAADLAATIITSTDKKHETALEKFERRKRIVIYSIMQILETAVLVIVLVVPNWFDDTYFSWIRKIEILDVNIVSMNQIAFLLVYVGIERIGATLYTDVVLPDFYNWLYNNGTDPGYEPHTSLFILVVTLADNWFRLTLQIQFILSSVYFVIVAGVIDILMGIIINERHLKFKWGKQKIRHTFDVLHKLSKSNFGKATLEKLQQSKIE